MALKPVEEMTIREVATAWLNQPKERRERIALHDVADEIALEVLTD